ncbi:Pantetheine-phosphate adenylyltransferase [Alteripontixanthobacter maritimus]|uniref:Phosphopantetheine adenylyltransferase n=1 Tax=Alteripontixanthobacter maritimus TaxID=2161824 RepID=A0A369Q4N0_9SPHN|nr:pantetheine-phosphate adenylyltransferase [Alteripontixanthobacter maritimus]RDC59853.1 Pantetheine-phosphate adenylyltransferase [Alteripontixanthobacter maritimus]
MSASAKGRRIGIYPGTFDPMTLGHADIIRRGAKLVDTLILGVTTNPSKDPMFDTDERLAMVKREVAAMGIGNVEVQGFNALLVKFARKVGATVILRGLRAVADFEYEYQMAGMNQQLDDDIETVFLMADVSLQPIASRLVKEIALFGGDITPFVSKPVCQDVIARVESIGRRGDY